MVPTFLEIFFDIVKNLNGFFKDFQVCFGDTYSVRMALDKILRFPQGDRLALTYAINFHFYACHFVGQRIINGSSTFHARRRMHTE